MSFVIPLQQRQLRQVLRIHDAERDLVVVDDDEIIDMDSIEELHFQFSEKTAASGVISG
jgi:hypothetical protein